MNKFFKNLLKLTIGLCLISILGSFLYVYQFQYHPAILMYHKISATEPATSALNVQPFYFEQQMKFLKEHHYNILPVEELAILIKTHQHIPRKTVAITFDDGFENNFTNAYPILKKHDIPATIFLVTSWIGKEGFLSWDEIKEMTQHHIQFGNHTLSHAHLPSLTLKDATQEIETNEKILISKLSHLSSVFCYPFGGYSKELQELLQKDGYTSAVATSPDGQSALDDPYAIRRIRISHTSNSLFIFGIETSGYYGFIRQIQKKIKYIKASFKKRYL